MFATTELLFVSTLQSGTISAWRALFDDLASRCVAFILQFVDICVKILLQFNFMWQYSWTWCGHNNGLGYIWGGSGWSKQHPRWNRIIQKVWCYLHTFLTDQVLDFFRLWRTWFVEEVGELSVINNIICARFLMMRFIWELANSITGLLCMLCLMFDDSKVRIGIVIYLWKSLYHGLWSVCILKELMEECVGIRGDKIFCFYCFYCFYQIFSWSWERDMLADLAAVIAANFS